MKYLWYLLFPIDVFLGNAHFVWLMYPASTEWYSSDVSEFIRISMWCLVGSAFALKTPEKSIAVSVLWWGLNTILDVIQTIQQVNYTDPSIEIAIAFFGLIVIFLYFQKQESNGSGKTE